MSRFNTTTARTVTRSPVTSEAIPSGVTHEGAPGYARDAKGELFLLAVAYMGSDNTFYETGKERDSARAAAAAWRSDTRDRAFYNVEDMRDSMILSFHSRLDERDTVSDPLFVEPKPCIVRHPDLVPPHRVPDTVQ